MFDTLYGYALAIPTDAIACLVDRTGTREIIHLGPATHVDLAVIAAATKGLRAMVEAARIPDHQHHGPMRGRPETRQ